LVLNRIADGLSWGFYNSYHGCYSTTIRVLTGFLQRIMGQLLSWLLLNDERIVLERLQRSTPIIVVTQLQYPKW